jgi:uncharacterized protein
VTARLRVRVRPAARGTRLKGWMADGTLKLEFGAPPEEGRANRAVVALLAGVLGVRESAVRVMQGQASRGKVVEVEGLNPAEVRSRIDAIMKPTAEEAR